MGIDRNLKSQKRPRADPGLLLPHGVTGNKSPAFPYLIFSHPRMKIVTVPTTYNGCEVRELLQGREGPLPLLLLLSYHPSLPLHGFLPFSAHTNRHRSLERESLILHPPPSSDLTHFLPCTSNSWKNLCLCSLIHPSRTFVSVIPEQLSSQSPVTSSLSNLKVSSKGPLVGHNFSAALDPFSTPSF